VKLKKIMYIVFFLGTALHDIHGMDALHEDDIHDRNTPHRNDGDGMGAPLRGTETRNIQRVPAISLMRQLSGFQPNTSATITSPRPCYLTIGYFDDTPTQQLHDLLNVQEPKSMPEALHCMFGVLELYIRLTKNNLDNTNQGHERFARMLLRQLKELMNTIALALQPSTNSSFSSIQKNMTFVCDSLPCIKVLITTIHNAISDNISDNERAVFARCDHVATAMKTYILQQLT